jgi:putative ABC transport system permease protein
MRPDDYLLGALEQIGLAKLRSFLTSLGIIIGVAAVVLILAISNGLSASVTNAFSELGSTRLTVSPSAPRPEGAGSGRGFGGGPPAVVGNVASTLTLDDAAALRRVDGVAAVAPVLQVAVRVGGATTGLNLAATGTAPAYAEITGQKLTFGRVFADGAGEVVLNEAAARRLFPSGPAVGQPLLVNGQGFIVVGVFADQASPFAPPAPGGAAAASESSPALFLPVERALALAGTENVGQILLTVRTPEQVDSTVARVRAALRERHQGVEDFALTSAQDLLASFNQIFGILTVGLAAIAAISLVVGGIGIMNIMLVSVTERTREIGIAKAIGATRRDIVVQFLVEAVVLSMLGGFLGLVIAWLGAALLGRLTAVPATVTPAAVALAAGVSALIGVFFGVTPAWRAARLDPIVALRHQ